MNEAKTELPTGHGFTEAPGSAKPSCAEIERRRNILGGIYLETDWNSDNLAVALMCYFEGHMDNPDNGQEDDYGNNLWAAQKVNEALDRIAEKVWPNAELSDGAGEKR